MPELMQNGILRGTKLVLGATDNMEDRAEWTSTYKLSTSDNSEMADIPQELFDSLGGVVFDIPIQAVEVRKTGARAAEAVARSWRKSFSLPTQPAAQLVKIRAARVGYEMYRLPATYAAPTTPSFDATTGLPNGDMVGQKKSDGTDNALLKDASILPRTYSWRVPVLEIAVHTVLDFDPTLNVASKIEHTNSDSIKWGSYTFPANTLLFNVAEVDYIETTLGMMYEVDYLFTARPGGSSGGWFQQNPRFNSTSSLWETVNTYMFQTTAFAGSFPVHA